MRYTLITKTGTCISFYNKTVAETYLGAYGGFLTCHDSKEVVDNYEVSY
jgi:hypothetical protein